MNKAVAAGIAACVSSLIVVPTAHASRDLGGVNVAAYCNAAAAYIRATGVQEIVDAGNAYSWRCIWIGGNTGVDMNQACVDQYGRGAWARPLDPHNAYSWQCFR